MTREKARELLEIPPAKIVRNPDNPRIFFRGEELDSLQASISEYGIQVPLTVYSSGHGKYTLIDGERRWRCARKLNLKTVPALVQDRPTPLGNLLLMFNIHALREQWDYFTIANRLPKVTALYKEENNSEPSEADLSRITGLTRGQIRRCRYLLGLPDRYRDILVRELEKPTNLQRLKEDFFIEMERALKTVRARIPDAIENLDGARNVLISKYKKGIIGNVTDFRHLSKMATAVSNLGIQERSVRAAIKRVIDSNDVGIEQVYSENFEFRYDEHKIVRSLESLLAYLDALSKDSQRQLDSQLAPLLRKLHRLIGAVLAS